MVSAQPSELLPKLEIPCLLVLERYLRNIMMVQSLFLLGNRCRQCGFSPGTTRYLEQRYVDDLSWLPVFMPRGVRRTSSCV